MIIQDFSDFNLSKVATTFNRVFMPFYHAFQRPAGRQTRGDTVEWRMRRERGTVRVRDRVVSDKEEGMSQIVWLDFAPGRVEHVARAIPNGICRAPLNPQGLRRPQTHECQAIYAFITLRGHHPATPCHECTNIDGPLDGQAEMGDAAMTCRFECISAVRLFARSWRTGPRRPFRQLAS